MTFWRTKYVIERYLEASGLSHTILRPTAFHGDARPRAARQGDHRGKAAVVFGSGNRPVNFVAAADVAAIALMALADRTAHSRTIEIGGPDNLTRHEVVALYARVAGRPPKTRHVPAGALRILSAVFRPVHEGLSSVMSASVYFDTVDQSFDPSETLRRYPINLTRLEDFVRARTSSAAPAREARAGVGSTLRSLPTSRS